MDQDWLEKMCDAKGISVACVGWETYAGRVEKDEEVRDVWRLAWERHAEAVYVVQTAIFLFKCL